MWAGTMRSQRACVSRHITRCEALHRARPVVLLRRSSRRCLVQAAAEVTAPPPAISLTDKAIAHLRKLRKEAGNEELLLRVGVKQGGCSGMSYLMDFEKPENVTEDDMTMDYEGGSFKLVCDPKSLLYLFGLKLDFSDALIGGGFQFSNPNAAESCGCGKSFGV